MPRRVRGPLTVCIWDGAPIRPEGEREDNAYWESEGDLPFLSGDGEEWRLGPMSPEEKMYRDMIEREGGDDGDLPPPAGR